MGDQEAKGDEYEKKAEKWGIFSSKYDDAAELFEKSGNCYKLAKSWDKAANVYIQLANCHIKLESKHEAASAFVDAAVCYKKFDSKEAIKYMNLAVQMYMEIGRLSMAAKYFKEIAEIYEKEEALAEAMEFYEKAAELYEGEESMSQGNQCKLKVAQFAAVLEQYDKAIEIFEKVASDSMNNNLTRYSVKGYLLNAGLCRLVGCDPIAISNGLEKYQEMDPSFSSSRECKLLSDLAAAIEEEDIDKFTDAVKEVDSMTCLRILSDMLVNQGQHHFFSDWPQSGVDDAKKRILSDMLVNQGQQHLFSDWPQSGVDDAKKMNFFSQVERLDANYPGGLEAYIQNAKALLADSKAEKNPFEGYVPTVPNGEHLTFGDKNFTEFEERGVKEAWRSAFVLVAGGLGERLGYRGIKIALPSELTTGICFLHLYIKSILALQSASIEANKGAKDSYRIPLVIMTSDDTHAKTQQLLVENDYFGMLSDQVVLLKQEKVACFQDNEARLALDASDRYIIQTKPHGHGDVHTLLFQSGLLPVWKKRNIEWVLFFQDTNGLLFKAIPSSLGVSAIKDLDVNSIAVPRKAKEAIGGICRLTHQNGTQMVINVEYNQLDPLLRATGHPDGDVNDASGFSPYPGNINQLIIKLGPYMEELARTNGAIKEFVNPKYKDASRTAFKSSTRLECMMQDYPRTLNASAKVGFTVMDTWLAYGPVKNNPEDAAKVPKGNPSHSATTGEMAIYRANSLILRHAGVEVEGPKMEIFNGQEVEVWPRIVWSPEWGVTYSTIKSKLLGTSLIFQKSTLVLDGKQIVLEDMKLDGTLVVRTAVEDAKAKLCSWRIQNSGWAIEPVDHKDMTYPEEVRIRGFSIKRLDQIAVKVEEAGNVEVGQHA